MLHRADKRGKGEHGWLSTRYSFSFADWYEPTRMGFGALRVINDDTIAPASGFGMHSHKDMEIITIVMSGTVTHKDSIGNTGTVPAGDVQVMSAGTGVTHSEYNESADQPLTLFQIWIMPKERNIAPRYAQKSFSAESALLVSPDGREGSLSIAQDAFISRVYLGAGETLSYAIKGEGNGVYVFIVDGSANVEDVELHARDALGVSGVQAISIASPGNVSLLVIEVPML